jgi:drug/metabolite transporter (DMT)-like permease
LRTALLVSLALVGFSANSLLTRGALGAGRIDPALFTFVRLFTGALTLGVLAQLRSRKTSDRGSWRSALALGGYAVLFTLAYARIGASVGALILFGSVQTTMIGAGLISGERPSPFQWIGLTLAVAGIVVLTRPGVTAPDLLGAALMAAAGACWGVYSLFGRASRDPLGATAGNFLRAVVCGVAVVAAFPQSLHASWTGVGLAAASGSLASGVGYTLWYAALPALAAWRAAVVQLIVPVLTALAAAVLLGEALTGRLAVATVLVGGGVWVTLRRGSERK